MFLFRRESLEQWLEQVEAGVPKGKLAAYIKRLMEENRLLDSEYVEPYAGGAAIAHRAN